MPPVTVGSVLALLVLVVVVVLLVIGQIAVPVGAMIGALALARLVP